MGRGFRAAWLAGLLTVESISAGGCAFVGGGASAPLQVTVEAADRLNSDENGESLPTVVRLYQLKAAGRIEAAELDQLYRDEKGVLGEDLLQVDELTVSPGERIRREVARVPEARVAVAVAVVRRPIAGAWRVATELKGRSPALSYRIEEYRIVRR